MLVVLKIINHIISYGSRDPSAVYDLGEMSNCARKGDKFILSEIPSKKVFHMPNGATLRAIVKGKIHHKLRENAISVYKVPGLKNNSLKENF